MVVRCALAAAMVIAVSAITACQGPLGRQYEYEEQLYLSINGEATVVIDASIPALVALRGLPLDPTRRSVVDRDEVRRLFATAGCQDVRVGQPWVRQGRRFIQIRVQTTDVNALAECRPLNWSTYHLERVGDELVFDQTVSGSANGDPRNPNWTGRELVAFKLHAPSRIRFHNVKNLDDGSDGRAERGNILTWEQWLKDRRAGTPVAMSVRMNAESILRRTLMLFAGAFSAAVAAIALVVWFVIRRARRRQNPAGS